MLAEFVDNSTQSRSNYGNLIDDVLKSEGKALEVSIVHDPTFKEMRIEDNSIGMPKERLVEALKIAHPTKDSKGRSRYGMGMKTAACWLGKKWSISTCEWDSGVEWTAEIDIEAIAHHNGRVLMTPRSVGKHEHYTKIRVQDLRRRVQKRTEETIREYLGSMYMFDLKPTRPDQVPFALTYNGTLVTPPVDGEGPRTAEQFYDLVLPASELQNLPDYKIYVRTLANGEPQEPFLAEGFPPLSKFGKEGNSESVISTSLQRYGRPRSLIEGRLKLFLLTR